MSKLVFVDVSHLKPIQDRFKRCVFTPRYMDYNVEQDLVGVTVDVFPYLELTRRDCQIVLDNIQEIIKFANTGMVR